MARSHVLVGAANKAAYPVICHLEISDLKDALRKGIADFSEMPSHAIFLCIIYPIVGIVLAQLILGYAMLPFLFPLAAGFALIGPIAALGLYEMSRRREAKLETDASHALDVLYSPSIGPIAALGVLLMILFICWVAIANAIYVSYFGYAMPTSIGQFAHDVLMTPAGWSLIVVGNLVGFVFAVVALIISAVSFPLLLDRDVGAAVALHTSIRVVLDNPRVMAMWGVIVAALLVLGSLPFFIGLAVVMPILGHATWHLYRKAVDARKCPAAKFRNPVPRHRYAADFPTSLFG
ncbi:MAG: DUF2189 domain-containing protein [Pseudolabrys sp.]